MPFKNARRQWVKLWVNEWLQGTIRFQLTAEQRSLWADLLAMAGASRIPGVIASGETNGIPDAYPPDYLANLLRCEEKFLKDALKIFEKQDRISLESGVITITNWHRYQSEYQRQAKYQKKYRDRLSGYLTETLPVEGEGEKKEIRLEEEKPPRFALPDWISKDAWSAFEEMRRKIRAPMTDRAREGIVRELEKLRELNDPNEVLLQSVTRAWRGVFELRRDGQNGSKAEGKSRRGAAAIAASRGLSGPVASDPARTLPR